MNPAPIEAFLARLYTDAALRESFLLDPAAIAMAAGLSRSDAGALARVDRAGLKMAAASYAHKREQHRKPKKKLHEVLISWWRG